MEFPFYFLLFDIIKKKSTIYLFVITFIYYIISLVWREIMRNDILKNFALRAKKKLLGKEKEKVTAKFKTITVQDDEFKEKVEYLLSKDEEIFNPIHFLMDDKILKNMDEASRERYLFSTIDKYNRFKNEILEEKSC